MKAHLIILLALVSATIAVPLEEAKIESDVASLSHWDIPVESVNFDELNSRQLDIDLERLNEADDGKVEQSAIKVEEHDFKTGVSQGPPLEESDQAVLKPIPGLIDLPQNLSTGYSQFEEEEDMKINEDSKDIGLQLEDVDFSQTLPAQESQEEEAQSSGIGLGSNLLGEWNKAPASLPELPEFDLEQTSVQNQGESKKKDNKE